MLSRTLSIALLATFFLAGSALASAGQSDAKLDATGTWKWTMQRQNGAGREVTLTLKQEGEKLTGSMSGMMGGADTEISDGTIKDGAISFKVTRNRNGQDFVTTYTGKLDTDEIKGTAAFDMGGQSRSRDWDAKRAKPDATTQPTTQP
jgi:hypothetical protein